MQPPYDLRDYLFDELTPGERAEMERFLETSAEARAELEQLELTQRALLSLPDEAPPQRIAFVSDKVFEPSLLARIGRWLWTDGPGLAFGTSLALAVLFAGIGLTEPRISSTDAGWELAFGAAPAEAAPVPMPVGLEQDEIRAIVVEALAQAAEEDREALVKLVAEQAEQSRRQWRSELGAAQSDIESWMFIVKANYEKLYNQVGTRDMAVAQ